MGWNNVVTHFSTGDRFRKHRKWIQGGIQDKEALEGYRCVQEREAVRVLCGLVELAERENDKVKEERGREGEYEGYVKRYVSFLCISITTLTFAFHPIHAYTHLFRYAASILTHIAYGHTLTSLTDPLLLLADKATTETVRAGSPGSNPLGALVEFYPVCECN